MKIRKGGSWRNSTSAYAYINGAWRQLLYGKCYIGGRWRTVVNFTTPTPSPTPTPTPTQSLTLGVSPTSARGSTASTTVVSQAITATPTGGRSPYTYHWSVVSSDGNSYTINSPTSASTTITGTGVLEGDNHTCSIRCVCTDSTGLSGTSASVPITFINFSNDLDLSSRL